jgi:hypothetical protein
MPVKPLPKEYDVENKVVICTKEKPCDFSKRFAYYHPDVILVKDIKSKLPWEKSTRIYECLNCGAKITEHY